MNNLTTEHKVDAIKDRLIHEGFKEGDVVNCEVGIYTQAMEIGEDGDLMISPVVPADAREIDDFYEMVILKHGVLRRLKDYLELHPSAEENATHYNQGGVECIDALKSATINLKGIEAVCTANAIKHLWRWESKNGVKDLKKAKWYIDRLIREVVNNG